MSIDWDLAARIAGPILAAFIAWGLTRLSERRSDLVMYYGHIAAFQTQQPRGTIHTHAVVIRNAGRKAATNVRVSHRFFLPDFTIYPPVQHTVEDIPNDGKEIVIPQLVTGEQISINYLYFPPVIAEQVTTAVRSDDGFAKVITVLPTQQHPRWVLAVGSVLNVIGIATVLYVLFSAGKAAWSRLVP